MLGVDPDGTIVLANREAERLLQPHTPLLGEPVQRVLGMDQPMPVAWTDVVNAPTTAAPFALTGPHWRVWARAMGSIPPRGVLMTLAPADTPTNAETGTLP